jgi:hypothetical protein
MADLLAQHAQRYACTLPLSGAIYQMVDGSRTQPRTVLRDTRERRRSRENK